MSSTTLVGALQKHAAALEDDPPTDEEDKPADEEAPTDDEETPADDEETPADEEGTPAEEDDKPTEEEETPRDAEDAPSEEEAGLALVPEDVGPLDVPAGALEPDDAPEPTLEDGAPDEDAPADVPTDVEPALDVDPGWLVTAALDELLTTPLLEPPGATARHTPSRQRSSRVQSASALHVRAQEPSTSTEPEGQDCEHPATKAAAKGPSTTTTAHRRRGENTSTAYHTVLS